MNMTSLCGSIKVQSGVSRGRSEVLLSGYGRLYEREAVSEFELATVPSLARRGHALDEQRHGHLRHEDGNEAQQHALEGRHDDE